MAKTETIARRAALATGIAGVAGVSYLIGQNQEGGFAFAQTGPAATAVPAPTPDARIGQTQSELTDLKAEVAALRASREVPSVAQLVTKGDIRVFGVPANPNNTVDLAQGPFKNTLGMGSQGFLAEPGGLLVGSDFESRFGGNPFGDNANGWKAMWLSKGHIKPFSGVSQEVLRADAK